MPSSVLQRIPVVLATLVLVVVSVVALSACAADPPEVPVGADGEPDPELAVGREVFAARCVSCHGESGGGGSGPNIQAPGIVERYPDVADQVAVVVGGRAGMPAFDEVLSAEEIAAVVRYTREVL